MENYDNNEFDLNLLEALIKNSESIKVLYDKLYNLEINNQKNTDEYKKILKYLIIAKEVEVQIYDNAGLDYDKCSLMVNYIIDNITSKQFLSNEESLILQDYRGISLRRIINSLLYKMRVDYTDIGDKICNSIGSLFTKMGINDPESFINNSVSHTLKFQVDFENNLTSSYILYLEEILQDKVNQKYREEIIKSKYYTTFINAQLEDEMILYNFGAFDKLPLFNAKYSYEDKNVHYMLANSYASDDAIHHIGELLELSDKDYLDDKNKLNSLLRECMLRSTFRFISDEVLIDINDRFNSLINGDIYNMSHKNDHIGIDKVKNCFRLIRKDKNRPEY